MEVEPRAKAEESSSQSGCVERTTGSSKNSPNQEADAAGAKNEGGNSVEGEPI